VAQYKFSIADATLAETFTGTSVAHAETGVTYNFASSVTYGYFWNGDPFVVSGGVDVTITSITPASNTTPPIKNGAALQPSFPDLTINVFDSRSSDYQGTSAINVDPGATGSNLVVPVSTYPNGASVIKSVSYATAEDRPDGVPQGSYIQRYSVLTVVPATPPANAFRPAVMASDKSVFFTLDQLDYSKLKNVVPVAGQISLDAAKAKSYLTGTQVSWHADRGAIRSLHPGNHHGGYNDYELDGDVVPALMALHSDYTDAEKEELYAKVVQHGIDYAAWNNVSNTWGSPTTHVTLYPPVIVTAAVALGAQELKDALLVPRTEFGNDNYFYVEESHVGVEDFSFTSSHTPSFQTYESGDVGKPDWRGSKLGASLSSAYRGISSDQPPILSLLIDMLGPNNEGRTLLNWPAFFDYGERMRLLFAVSDDIGNQFFGSIHRQEDEWRRFINAYRATYTGTSGINFKPEAPKSITLTPGNGSFDYLLDGIIAPGSSPITRVDIQYKPAGGNWTLVSDAGYSGTVSGLTNGTTYLVRARFANAHGDGPWSYNGFNTKNRDIDDWMLANGYITQAELDSTYNSSLTFWRKSGNYQDQLRSIANAEAGFETATAEFITRTVTPSA